MDLPVVLIKVREYIFGFGPAFLLALSLGAVAELLVRRLLRLREPGVGPQTQTDLPIFSIWQRVSGSYGGQMRITLPLFIWLSVSGQALSLVALLVTAALSLPLALLRAGTTLLLASLLAALVPLLTRKEATNVRGSTALLYSAETVRRKAAPDRTAQMKEGKVALVSLPVEWWRSLRQRYSLLSNSVFIGVVLGGAMIGLSPTFYSLLSTGGSALSYLVGPALGLLSMLAPGTDVPLISALQGRNLGGLGLALMLGVSTAPLMLVREIKGLFGLRTMAIFIACAWLLATIAAWMLVVVLGAAGLSL